MTSAEFEVDWELLRHQLVCRYGGRCEHCGRPLGDRWEAHHRRLEGQGGPAELANLVALRQVCHIAAHAAPWTAIELGIIVPSWADWKTVPLTRQSGQIVMLDEFGGWERQGWNPDPASLAA